MLSMLSIIVINVINSTRHALSCPEKGPKGKNQKSGPLTPFSINKIFILTKKQPPSTIFGRVIKFFVICQKRENFRYFQNFDDQPAVNDRKIKIIKIPDYNLCIILESSPDIKTSISITPSNQIFDILGENWDFHCFSMEKPYFCLKTRVVPNFERS